MAREKKQRRPKDPEGRMSLGEHLTELRDRLVWCAVTILVMAVVGWMVFDWVFAALQAPFVEAEKEGLDASLNFQGVGTGLNVRLQMAAYIGLLLSMPMVMFQAWRFVTPGLHRHERRYAIGFFGSAIPLFIIGCGAGYYVINKAVPILVGFTPQIAGVTQIITYDQYLGMLVKTMLAFGIAFIMPVVLVLLNFLGVLSGRSMLKAWRWVTLLCFVFTAVMVPTPDPFMMTFMALPMVGLYFAAVGISLLHDRRVERALDLDLPDDEASAIDDEVEAIDAPSPIDEVERQ